MQILVTNDDGIDSIGLHVLARKIEQCGHDVLVVAPNFDASGTGASIGPLAKDEEVIAQKAQIAGFDGKAFALNGPPALCVITSHLNAFDLLPELVVSGINPGLNTGRATLHSGTVSAAMTAQNFGSKGIAVSIDSAGDNAPEHWDSAAEYVAKLLPYIATASPKTVLNLSVPDIPLESIRGLKWARLAPFGSKRSALQVEADGKLIFGLIDTEYAPDEETDLGLIKSGFAAVSELSGIAAKAPTGSAYGDALLV
jgi:5'-nucleotidase